MLGHIGIHCADLEASRRFYDTVLHVIGGARIIDLPTGTGYGTTMPDFWIYQHPHNDTATPPHPPTHVAFDAADAPTVDSFFDTALANGATALHAPRHWPEYHDHYYAAFVADPDGHNIEAVCHTVAPATHKPDGGKR